MSGAPPGARAKMGKSARRSSVRSATGGIRFDVLTRRRQLAGDLLAHELFQGLVGELADQRLEEALDDHADRTCPVKATALHVEDGRLVELADRAAVRGRDV